MKYKVGDKTILGEITRISEIVNNPYIVKNEEFCHYFSESEIDAIVIKPKRNIDHLIELIEAKKREEAVAFIDYGHNRNAPWSNLIALLQPYVESRKYPVLTPDELKAVKWLVEGGYTSIQNYKNENVEASYGTGVWFGTEWIPIAKCLESSAWITETPINLKELLDAQEDV